MPYAPHYRLTLSGVLGSLLSPAEEFSFSLALDNPGAAVQGPVVPAAVITACQNYFGRVTTHIGGTAFLTRIRLSSLIQDPLGPNTKATGTAQALSSVPGGGSTSGNPFQIAVAVSLNAATATKQFKGRFYLPSPTSMGFDPATGRHSQFATADVVTSSKTFVNDLNAETTLGSVIVASSISGNHPVSSIRVGDVPDTIRRRRNEITEAYTGTSIP